jgi:hypothetical protein
MRLRGVVGRIDWGYFAAAAINGYTVTLDQESGRFQLRATVVTHDAFKLTQRPLVFVAPTKRAEWRFAIQRFEFNRAAGVLTADMTPLPDALR